METLLSKRIKNLVVILILISLFFLFIFLFAANSFKINRDKINKNILKDIRISEKNLENKITNYKKRAWYLHKKYKTRMLEHSEMNQKEALVIEKRGVIFDYYGEIYCFEFKDIDVGKWFLTKKNSELYFVQRMERNLFYIRYFFDLKDNFIFKTAENLSPVIDLKFFDSNISSIIKNNYQYDKVKEIYFFDHILKYSNNQLILYLKFSKKDLLNYFKMKQKIFLYLSILLFFLMIVFILYRKKRLKSGIFLFIISLGIFTVLYHLVSLIGEKNLFLNIFNFKFNSIYEILVMVIFLNYLFFLLLKRFKDKLFSYILFNVSACLILIFSDMIFKSVDFFYSNFNLKLNYLTLISVIFLLHMLPLLFSNRIKIKMSIFNINLFFIIQLVFFVFFILTIKKYYVNFLLFSIILFILFFFKKSFVSRLLVFFMITVSIFLLLLNNSTYNKKEFISNNLKNIFFNQGNYAKFIAREIVHEINSTSANIKEFFQKDSPLKLETVWRNSLASKENVASGIFILSNDEKIDNYFSLQIPYIRVKERDFFPFWAIEDVKAFLYGKEISLAIASISVFDKSKHLGYIIVEVLNSPELIIKRNTENINIFSIDKKIKVSDLSYIKFNENNQVLENPSDINLKNISGIVKYNNKWISFKHMGFEFKGFIFKNNKNHIIIFYPKNSVVKNFSEIFKMYLFFMLFFILFNLNELKIIEWKLIYFSFSIRVFVILILISLFTAIIFSIFSLNFNNQLSKRHLREFVYDKGKTAQNIINNIVKDKGELGRDNLFLLSKIIDNDVSVYQSGNLLYTSNYKKIIESKIPEYLSSNILDLLDKKNQEFHIETNKNSFNLFFKISDYIFNIDFSYKGSYILSSRENYTDFIITLFFILLIIGFSVAFFFRNKILAPINVLNEGMSDVEKGNLKSLKKLPSEMELRNLYLGFNSMVEGIKEQKKSISEISRMKTLIKLGRRIAHEVKNPLTPIKLSAEQVLKSLKDKRENFEEIIEKSVNFIIEEAEHLKKVSYGFLDFTHIDEIDLEETNLYDLVKEELSNFKHVYPQIDFTVNSVSENIIVLLDKIKIKQALKNILTNSIEAIGERRGSIQLELVEDKNCVIINIIDNGIGMTREEMDLIFNEDYSTKEDGTGIGLYITKRIVELHNGKIEIFSKKNKGTKVILNLKKNVFKT